MIKISVKKFHKDHSKDLLNIFNSARNSGFFYRRNKIKLKEHKAWLETNLKEKKIDIFLAFKKNSLKPLGYVRFDKLSEKKKIYEVSIAIMKGSYGKGLGTIMLGLSIKRFKLANKMVAIVKKNNPRSWKVFVKNFFKIEKIKTKKKVISKNPFNYRTEYYLKLKLK